MCPKVFWPGYYENQIPQRIFAYDSGGRILTEHGEILSYSSWNELKQIVLRYEENGMILLSENLNQYLPMGAVADPRTVVRASTQGSISSISIRGHRQRRRLIVAAQCWSEILHPSMILLVRATMEHCGAGDRPTPSSLGQAIARQVWKDNNLRWHGSSPKACQESLRLNSPSPRTETPGVGWHGEEAWEYDLNSAYIEHSRELPTGRTLNIMAGENDWYNDLATWYRLCVVRVKYLANKARLSPIHYKDGHTTRYPNIQGEQFITWIWKEQADAARELGFLIFPDEGWGWFEKTEGHSKVADRFNKLRDTAPAAIQGIVKRSALSHIGRFAMQSDDWEVVEMVPDHLIELHPDCYRPLRNTHHSNDESAFSRYWIALKSKSRGGLIHWQRYIVMRTNQTIWEIGSTQDTNLLMTNFDSLTFSGRLHSAPPGTKEIHLTNVSIPYARAIISDQKTKQPGKRTVIVDG